MPSCLIHLHIPRTGGTTLRNALLPRLLLRIAPEQVFLLDIGPEHGCRSGSFSELAALPPRERAELRFITGHMPPDVMDLVPEPVAFAVMRSPVDRVLSEYWYCYHAAENPAHVHARRLTPVEFCQAGFGHTSNGQARYLSGSVFGETVLAGCQLYRRGRRTLERLAFIGSFSRFQRTLDGIAAIARVDPMDGAIRLNPADRITVSSHRDRLDIARANAVDMALYTAAAQFRLQKAAR